jgi:phage head maturation protease
MNDRYRKLRADQLSRLEAGERVRFDKVITTLDRKSVDVEDGINEVTITNEATDRDGDIVRAGGANVDNYLNNPIVLFGHNYRDPEAVVAKTLELKTKKKAIRARFQFAPWETSIGADTTRRLWDGGFLNAASIGFIPTEWEEIIPEGADPNDSPFWGWPLDFLEWELLEWSIVPVPANQEALRSAAIVMGKEFPSLRSNFEAFVNLLDIKPITRELEEDGVGWKPGDPLPGIRGEHVRERMKELMEEDGVEWKNREAPPPGVMRREVGALIQPKIIHSEDPGLDPETVIETIAGADLNTDDLTEEEEAALAEFAERLNETIKRIREVF